MYSPSKRRLWKIAPLVPFLPLTLEEINERILFPADLDQDDVIIACLHVTTDSLEMTFQ